MSYLTELIDFRGKLPKSEKLSHLFGGALINLVLLL